MEEPLQVELSMLPMRVPLTRYNNERSENYCLIEIFGPFINKSPQLNALHTRFSQKISPLFIKSFTTLDSQLYRK